MALRWSDLVGTVQGYLRLGTGSGVRLKNSGGNLSVRNAGDSADAALTASQVNVSGDDLVLNSDAAGSGADRTLTLRRPSTGMTAAAVITFPSATGTLALAGAAGAKTVADVTGTTYTLDAADVGKILRFTNSAGCTITCPNSLSVGFFCEFFQAGAGAITFSAGSGATVNSHTGRLTSAGQYTGGAISVVANSGGSAAAYILAGTMAYPPFFRPKGSSFIAYTTTTPIFNDTGRWSVAGRRYSQWLTVKRRARLAKAVVETEHDCDGVRIGLYASDADGQPTGTLIAESSEMSSAANTANIWSPSSLYLDPGIYVIQTVIQTSGSIRGFYDQSGGVRANITSGPFAEEFYESASYGAFPSSPSDWSDPSTFNYDGTVLRVAVQFEDIG